MAQASALMKTPRASARAWRCRPSWSRAAGRSRRASFRWTRLPRHAPNRGSQIALRPHPLRGWGRVAHPGDGRRSLVARLGDVDVKVSGGGSADDWANQIADKERLPIKRDAVEDVGEHRAEGARGID